MSLDPADPIDKVLMQIRAVDSVAYSIRMNEQRAACDRETIEASTKSLAGYVANAAESQRELDKAREATHEIAERKPSGKSIKEDLDVLGSLYRAVDGSTVSAVYRDRFTECQNEFIVLHPVPDDHPTKGYTIWVGDGDTSHRVDVIWKGEVWRNSDGVPLYKSGGVVIADHGIVITPSDIYKMTRNGFTHLDTWVAYHLEDVNMSESVSESVSVPASESVSVPASESVSVPASESVHSDKKRRADDD